MGGTEPRILAVTDSASLVIGLTFSHRGWDVASQAPDAATSLEADVVVFDLGTTRAGLEAARQLEPTARALVIGDEEPAEAPPAGVHVLVRPYTVDDLTDRVDQLLSPAALERARWVDPPEAGEGEAESAGATATADLVSPPDVEVSALEQTSSAASGNGDRVRRADRGEPRRSLSSRLFGRVADAPSTDRDATASTSRDEASAAEEPTETRSEADAEPPAATDEAGLTVALDDGLAVEVVPDDDGTVPEQERDAVPVAPPPPPPASPPLPTGPAASAATALLERRVVHVTAGAASTLPAVRPARWRARRQKAGTASERQLRERLARVLAATSELERLTDEVPLLKDLPALATAVVREAVSQLEADTVGLWRPGGGGWQVEAHHGLTRHEASWTVPFDQPLFAEVHATGGALLLDPVDAVQAAVVGIGGAHTESFMAASIAAGPGRYGILAVGRDRQLVEEDLDILGELALEMAPGLAVAEQLERLQHPAPVDGHETDGATDRRPWRTAAER